MLWLAFGSYAGLIAAAPALGARPLAIVAGIAILVFALAPPLLSQDVFSYISAARLGTVHGLDPYLSPPLAAPTDPVLPHVGWTESVSAYGPLFTLATYPLGPVGVPVALWSLKALGALGLAGLAALTARVAPARGIDPARALAVVALNPLLLVHLAGGAHNDGLAMLAALGGVAAVLAARPALGGAGLLLAAAIKLPTAISLPFALVGDGGRRKIAAGAIAAAAGVVLLALPAFGWSWTESLGLAGENQGRVANYSLPNLASELTGVGIGTVRATALLAFALALAGLLAWTARGADWLRAAGWATLAMLLATAWLLPWYLAWLLPLTALARDRALLTATLALTALQLAARVPL